MSEFAFVTADMDGAQAAATTAAADVRGADGTGALATLAAALPGTSTEAALAALAELWESGIRDWAEAAEGFADGVGTTAHDGTATDNDAGGLFGGLLGGIFGGP